MPEDVKCPKCGTNLKLSIPFYTYTWEERCGIDGQKEMFNGFSMGIRLDVGGYTGRAC